MTDTARHFDEHYLRLQSQGSRGWTRGEDREIHHRQLLAALDFEACPREGRALDLGCGAGDWSLLLAGRGFEVTGVDISPVAIDWAREQARREGADVTFRLGNVLELDDLSTGHFDFILDGFVLHCLIGSDRACYLRTARRLLRPGGMFFIHAFCATEEQLRAEPYADWIDPQTRLDLDETGTARRYVAHPDELLGELRDAGLEILRRNVVLIPAQMMHVYCTRLT